MKLIRKLLILCAVYFISSCGRSWYEVREIEQLLDARLMGKVKFVDRQDKWVNLNGDGEKVVLLDVMDTTALCHSTSAMLPYDSTMIEQRFVHSLLYPYLKHMVGYYIDIQEGDQQQCLFYDTVGSHLVYYLSFM